LIGPIRARFQIGTIGNYLSSGYAVHLIFLWLPSVEMAISRVAKRIRESGHNIPEVVIRRRFTRGLANLFELYIPLVSTACVYDASQFPVSIITEIAGEDKQIFDYNRWNIVELQGKNASND
jgi:predicted ABC-type ATPase